jgi:Protein of unknown function (DUF1153)
MTRKTVASSRAIGRKISTPIYAMFTQWVRPNLIATSYNKLWVRECVLSIMTEQQMRARGRYVIGPDGSPLTVADLPPRDTKRWVIRRKAEVVAAVRGGLLSMEEACERYTLTVDEFLSWQRSIDKHGLPGLRATKVQDYRD